MQKLREKCRFWFGSSAELAALDSILSTLDELEGHALRAINSQEEG